MTTQPRTQRPATAVAATILVALEGLLLLASGALGIVQALRGSGGLDSSLALASVFPLLLGVVLSVSGAYLWRGQKTYGARGAALVATALFGLLPALALVALVVWEGLAALRGVSALGQLVPVLLAVVTAGFLTHPATTGWASHGRAPSAGGTAVL